MHYIYSYSIVPKLFSLWLTKTAAAETSLTFFGWYTLVLGQINKRYSIFVLLLLSISSTLTSLFCNYGKSGYWSFLNINNSENLVSSPHCGSQCHFCKNTALDKYTLLKNTHWHAKKNYFFIYLCKREFYSAASYLLPLERVEYLFYISLAVTENMFILEGSNNWPVRNQLGSWRKMFIKPV